MNNFHYNLALPPRQVPLPLQGQVLFGGFFNQFGWLFFGFGMIFVWIFGLSVDFSPLYFAFGNSETAQGTISAIQETNASINNTPVYANQFIFRVEKEEAEYRGESYTTGSRYSVGQNITVEFLSAAPNISRIQGSRGGEFGGWILCLAGIFPAVGLAFIVAGTRQGIKGNRLLANGKLTRGKLLSKEPTNTRINNQTVYKLTFEFIADDGLYYETAAKNHQPYNLEDEEFEQILYDPTNPGNAVLVDNLPGSPEIDEMGNIQTGNLKKNILPLILPALVLSIHGTIFLSVIL